MEIRNFEKLPQEVREKINSINIFDTTLFIINWPKIEITEYIYYFFTEKKKETEKAILAKIFMVLIIEKNNKPNTVIIANREGWVPKKCIGIQQTFDESSPRITRREKTTWEFNALAGTKILVKKSYDYCPGLSPVSDWRVM